MHNDDSGNGKILRKSLLTASLVTGSRLCAFLATLAAVNFYGSAEFGAISVAQQISLYAVMIASLGMDKLAVRLIAGSPNRVGEIATTVISWRMIVGVPVYLLVLLATWAIPALNSILTLVAVFGITIFTQGVTVLWVPQAVQRPLVHGATLLVTQALFFVFLKIGIHFERGPWVVPGALVLAQSITAVGLLAWMKLRVGPLRRPLGLVKSREFLKTAIPFGTSNILRGLAASSDLILLGVLLGKSAEVGWYSGASRLYLFGHGLLTVYFVVLYPILARRAAEGRAQLGSEVKRSLIRTVPIAAFGLGIFVWFAGDVLLLLFPDDFIGAKDSLRFLLLALFASTLAGQFGHSLMAMNFQIVDMRNTLIAAVVHVTTKVILIGQFGIVGAAIGCLAGEATLLVLGASTFALALKKVPSNE